MPLGLSSSSSARTLSRSRERSRSSRRGRRRACRPCRGRAARSPGPGSRGVGAHRCVGPAGPAGAPRGVRARTRAEGAVLLAVGLASHVGRVRAAQALAEEGLGAREIAGRLKMKEFPARKALQHAERYSRGELDSALVRLAELDAAIKGASRLSARARAAAGADRHHAASRAAGGSGGATSVRRRAARPAPSCAPRCSCGARRRDAARSIQRWSARVLGRDLRPCRRPRRQPRADGSCVLTVER